MSLGGLGAAVLLSGCGGAAPAENAPKSPEPAAEAPAYAQPPAGDIGSAQAELDRAAAELDGAVGGPALGGEPMGGHAGAAPRSEPLSEGGCVTACRALSSMQRAASHLCELAGEGDARCATARRRVEDAEGRVKAACPTCP